MSETAKQKQVGVLRIYLDPREQSNSHGGWFGRERQYKLLVRKAKSAGLMVGLANRSPFGFSIGDVIAVEGFKAPMFTALIVIELVGTRSRLQSFCHANHSLLKKKVVLYQSAEHWSMIEAAARWEGADPIPASGDISPILEQRRQ